MGMGSPLLHEEEDPARILIGTSNHLDYRTSERKKRCWIGRSVSLNRPVVYLQTGGDPIFPIYFLSAVEPASLGHIIRAAQPELAPSSRKENLQTSFVV